VCSAASKKKKQSNTIKTKNNQHRLTNALGELLLEREKFCELPTKPSASAFSWKETMEKA